MAEIAHVRMDEGAMAKHDLPEGVLLYEVAGPLFFGAAERAMGAFESIAKKGHPRVVILLLSQVPAIDATGLVALETVIENLKRHRIKVILAGIPRQPSEVIARSVKSEPGRVAFAPDLASAASIAVAHTARAIDPT
jgi:SulP family sulfate permease